MKTSYLAISFFFLSACSATENTDSHAKLLEGKKLESVGTKTIFACEGDEALVNQYKDDPAHFQLAIKNNDINMYLQLGYLARPEGRGLPMRGGSTFTGFNSVISHFTSEKPASVPFITAHILPQSGGLKIVVDTQPHYYCHYQPLFGDSSGSTHTIVAQPGKSCPNLGSSYEFRNASAGLNVRTSKNWFFQNCHMTK